MPVKWLRITSKKAEYFQVIPFDHRLWTPNEGINQKNQKIWVDMADKICFGRIQKFGSGRVDFQLCREVDGTISSPGVCAFDYQSSKLCETYFLIKICYN